MVTIKDISKATGFSTTTVSRALNGYLDVNENTRKKIQVAAEKLGYTPNILARSLVMKNSKTVGLLITDLKRSGVKDNFLFQTLCGAMDQLQNMEYELVVLTTTTSKQRNKTYQQLCNERNLDGIIIQGLKVDDPYVQEAQQSSKPCVFIDIPIDAPNTGYVTTNQTESATQATKYLCRLGHECIGFINGHDTAHVSKERLRGYQQALEECELPFKPEYVYNGEFDEDKAKQCAISLILSYPEITAIFCASDVMALGVMKAARELNISIPDQLSVIGFDNILLSEYVTPSLTTVSQNPYEMGRRAADMMISLIEGKETDRIVVLNNELVLRDTTASPKLVEM
ncbi:LacI family DNA-binding transcriptional regulator [Bacillus massiliigorillae]|uniref:LacI family DNA-binding transcriptional regulator n=1 Tax=Bacillus massiliigorillae TaxID=1243664 RepID=UPI00039B849C|nr:LacI family DNA-binding transcriptional regulator [Bacillus massiliigorillae]